MTPERIEEIKKAIPEAEKFIEQNKIFIQLGLGGFTDKVFSDMRYLLAALEDAQQHTDHEREIKNTFVDLSKELKKQLIEAQQTIARQEKALNEIIAYSTDQAAVDCASVAMGYVEGDSES